jgi:ribose-phosphate pyrophosphokinase
VLPYFGYARQDRRTQRRSLGARVAANIITAGRFDRLMLIDAHTPSIEGFFDIPIDHMTAVPVLAEAVKRSVRGHPVVVAPDLGAVKRAREYARVLQAPMALVHKTRLSGEMVEVQGVIGEVRNLVPVIVDDMLSTGGTIEAAVGALRAAGALEPMTGAVTHALLSGRARDILRRLPMERLFVGNTVPINVEAELPLEVASVAPLIATAIRRNHYDESLVDLRVRT